MSLALRESLTKYRESATSQEDAQALKLEFDTALEQSMSNMLRKSEKFAAKVCMVTNCRSEG